MSWMITLGVCLQIAAPYKAVAFIPSQAFTLAWEHTIEKVRWEEDYRVQLHSDRPQLVAGLARVTGSAAGMEPPPNAVRRAGWYEYQPVVLYPGELRLTRSEFSADYEWCEQNQCVSLATYLPSDGGVTLLQACESQRLLTASKPLIKYE